ncbi:phosphoribosyltransferase family protein [Geodermatophilus sp. CPCC 206100]|uniref:phosphoribosyltransferase family protein n=1 Tax=Geodermatophilus sp. CPCC 206100 TaxID=3020054 RepID=UPI003B004C59
MPFTDRRDAGQRLGRHLAGMAAPGVVVLGLPRGGVPVAAEVARALGAPLDVILVRKLGLPQRPELAMGAVGEDGVVVLNEDVLQMGRVAEQTLADVRRREEEELLRRARRFRGDRPRVPLAGRTAVVVDDGIATGATARVACAVARAHGAARVVLATPVGSPQSLRDIGTEVDELVCLEAPHRFAAVGQAYDDFAPTTDDEVVELLRGPVPRDEDVTPDAAGVPLPGRLTVPAGATGLVVFAHGSGSGRSSPRNRRVARRLQEAGLATLLVDLLTPDEAADRDRVFDVALLAARLAAVTADVRSGSDLAALPLGWFGASTGAAAALWAAAEDDGVRAVVSRGGRPDLAGPRLAGVRAPTLLVVGGRDGQVLELNRLAQARLRCESRLVVVPGATHLFEEPGTLDEAACLARDWLLAHLA